MPPASAVKKAKDSYLMFFAHGKFMAALILTFAVGGKPVALILILSSQRAVIGLASSFISKNLLWFVSCLMLMALRLSNHDYHDFAVCMALPKISHGVRGLFE